MEEVRNSTHTQKTRHLGAASRDLSHHGIRVSNDMSIRSISTINLLSHESQIIDLNLVEPVHEELETLEVA